MIKKKIAIFHELPDGGARRGANEFARELKKDYIVDLYVIDYKENTSEKVYCHNLFFYAFLPKAWSGGNWKVKLYKDTLELLRLFTLHKRIAENINKEQYTFVFVHGSKFTQAPFILRCLTSKKIYYCQEPLRMTLEEYFAVPQSLGLVRRIYEQCIRFIRKNIDKTNMQKADMILSNSKFTRENIYKAYKMKAQVCYMGVDRNAFTPDKKKKNIDILFIGSYDFVDGFPLLQESLQHIKSISPIIGYITHEDGWIGDDSIMRDYYNRSKLVVCFGYREPFGLIPLEAMACGIPVVALDEGGYKETVQHNVTGFLVPRDPQIIGKKLEELLTHTQLRQTFGKNARSIIEKQWTWEKSLQNFLKKISAKLK